MRFISTITALVLTLLHVGHARAQLVGCDAVKCPAGGCVVGNVTNLDLGIASFTSDISPGHDLTWTVGLADIPHRNSINDTWLKSYYLGTPSTLDLMHLESVSEISGCALFFFEDETVVFNASAPESGVGNCQGALNAQCVDELLALATNSTTMLSSGSSNANETYLCSQLQEVLAGNIPKSCLSKGLTGRAIVAKELTESDSSLLSVQQSSCNASTGGQAYNIGLVESEDFRSDTYISAVSAYVFGITPVLTVFYPNFGTNSALLGGQAESHLTCLKIVEAGAPDGGSRTLLNAAPSLRKACVWIMVSSLLLIAQILF